MRTDNNCETCRHNQHKDGGHCYMFQYEPSDICMQHTIKVDAWEKLKRNRELIQTMERLSKK